MYILNYLLNLLYIILSIRKSLRIKKNKYEFNGANAKAFTALLCANFRGPQPEALRTSLKSFQIMLFFRNQDASDFPFGLLRPD